MIPELGQGMLLVALGLALAGAILSAAGGRTGRPASSSPRNTPRWASSR